MLHRLGVHKQTLASSARPIHLSKNNANSHVDGILQLHPCIAKRYLAILVLINHKVHAVKPTGKKIKKAASN